MQTENIIIDVQMEREESELQKAIPQDIRDMVNFISEKIKSTPIFFERIELYNIYGYHYGYAYGFTLTHCSSSYAEGPSPDYSKAFQKFLQGLDFEIANSYGDNGLDSATNWHNTFWNYDFIYTPSIQYFD